MEWIESESLFALTQSLLLYFQEDFFASGKSLGEVIPYSKFEEGSYRDHVFHLIKSFFYQVAAKIGKEHSDYLLEVPQNITPYPAGEMTIKIHYFGKKAQFSFHSLFEIFTLEVEGEVERNRQTRESSVTLTRFSLYKKGEEEVIKYKETSSVTEKIFALHAKKSPRNLVRENSLDGVLQWRLLVNATDKEDFLSLMRELKSINQLNDSAYVRQLEKNNGQFDKTTL